MLAFWWIFRQSRNIDWTPSLPTHCWEQNRGLDWCESCSLGFTGQPGKGLGYCWVPVLTEESLWGSEKSSQRKWLPWDWGLSKALIWIEKVKWEQHVQKWNHEVKSWCSKKWDKSQSGENKLSRGHKLWEFIELLDPVSQKQTWEDCSSTKGLLGKCSWRNQEGSRESAVRKGRGQGCSVLWSPGQPGAELPGSWTRTPLLVCLGLWAGGMGGGWKSSRDLPLWWRGSGSPCGSL